MVRVARMPMMTMATRSSAMVKAGGLDEVKTLLVFLIN